MPVYFLHVVGLFFTPPCLLLNYKLLNNGLHLFPEVKQEISQITYLLSKMVTPNELSNNLQRLTIETNK